MGQLGYVQVNGGANRHRQSDHPRYDKEVGVKLPRTARTGRTVVATDSITGTVTFKKAHHQNEDVRTKIPDTARQLLSLRQVKEQVGASSASIWRWVGAKTFPPPVRLSPAVNGRRVAWHAAEIYGWIAQRPRSADTDPDNV
jgi:predicted DNA-binding transcriptional regulator AlpA